VIAEYFHIYIFSHSAVTLIMDDETFETLGHYHYKVMETLDGPGRMRFINHVFDEWVESQELDFPKREQQQYSELLTDLVKDFGH